MTSDPAPPPPVPPSRVMLVDDNPAFRGLIRRVLGEVAVFGEYSTGASAVADYATFQPDWVFMDIAMPGWDGLETTRRLKSRHPSARVVMVTQYDDPELRHSAQTAGACGYVVKDDLHSLNTYLRPPPAAPPSTSSSSSLSASPSPAPVSRAVRTNS